MRSMLIMLCLGCACGSEGSGNVSDTLQPETSIADSALDSAEVVAIEDTTVLAETFEADPATEVSEVTTMADTVVPEDTIVVAEDTASDTAVSEDTTVTEDSAVSETLDVGPDTAEPTRARADLIAWTVSGGTVALGVRRSTGTVFGPVETWTGSDSTYFGGSAVNGLGDFDGDGKSDLLAWTVSGGLVGLTVRRATSTAFGPAEIWTGSDNAFFSGGLVNGIGDFDGDGRADLLAWTVSGGTVALNVRRSTGTAFAAVETWTGSDTTFFSGGLVNGLGDFDGDGRTDLLAWNVSGGTVALRLRRSTGTAFGAAETWTGESTTFFGGSEVNGVGDFDGDGRADLLAWTVSGGITGLTVRRSTGTAFAAAETWTGADNTYFSGGELNALGDFDGDGRVDLLAWTVSGGKVALRVRRSTGSAFAAAETWTGDDDTFFSGGLVSGVADFDGPTSP